MTSEEAIKYLKKMKDECNDTFHKVRYVTREEALEKAIKALEQEPSGDMVSRGLFEQVKWERDVAIEQLKELGYGLGEKPKIGHWIDHQEGRWIYAQCSECGTVHDTQTNYCPNCGAKMESEDKE